MLRENSDCTLHLNSFELNTYTADKVKWETSFYKDQFRIIKTASLNYRYFKVTLLLPNLKLYNMRESYFATKLCVTIIEKL